MRKIIHCDCDCFYAAVEMRDDPSLKNLPIAIGGKSDRRGVVATCNYKARQYGVHSAMPTGQALKLCPDLVVIPGTMAKYREAAQQIRQIFYRYTDKVEPLSLDEAYLDVTDCTECQGSATLIAQEIRQVIAKEVGVTASAGIAPNKFLAKVASDLNKPDGQFVITPDNVDGFVEKLEVKRIFGVGKVTNEKMRRLGIITCGDLQQRSVIELVDKFGVFGKRLHDLSFGRDDREVNANSRRKSLSVENTFSDDLADLQACQDKLPNLLVELRSRLRRIDSDYLVTKQFIKMKFNDFTATTVERQMVKNLPIESFENLCNEAWERSDLPVRLLGIGVRFVDTRADGRAMQLELFP
ncbi:DNA polymerase IV [Porticoccaceae bacterium]|nr:DNA polymerase IV [Porticoccaceae bacterium]MDB4109070.1 DNA polymerase IV [Porticoccaceae bacterium]MDB9843008.1 DNA polymerase IV [Porticoccaceae bacterium]MDC0133580.1 DNA polymerase IV [Porticoccaceae bacterium]MDC1476695.1 DNA polymerase IV [Porticoccaceae bacterium]